VEETAPSSFVAIRRSLNELNSSDPILLSFKLWGVKLTVVLLCSTLGFTTARCKRPNPFPSCENPKRVKKFEEEQLQEQEGEAN
jgi:hypothetical protein